MKKILVCFIISSCSIYEHTPVQSVKYQDQDGHCIYIEEYGHYVYRDYVFLPSETKYVIDSSKSIEYTLPCKSIIESDLKNNINKQTMSKINR